MNSPLLLRPIFLLFLTGCSVSTGFKYTKIKDAAPIPLRFSSAKAATVFYGTFFKRPKSVRWRAELFFSGNLGPTEMATDTCRLNAAFLTADTNKDGVVSEKEATAYADSLKK